MLRRRLLPRSIAISFSRPLSEQESFRWLQCVSARDSGSDHQGAFRRGSMFIRSFTHLESGPKAGGSSLGDTVGGRLEHCQDMNQILLLTEQCRVMQHLASIELGSVPYHWKLKASVRKL